MRRLAVLLLTVAAGCATVQTNEPFIPEPVFPITDQMEPAPAPPTEQGRVAAVAPEKKPEPGPASTTSAAAAADPAAPEHTSASSPEQTAQPAAPPHTSKKAAVEKKEHPVSDRRLQGLVELAARNDAKIMNVFVGMYQKTVKSIMGDQQNPYKRQTINGSDGAIYEVVFYLTREPRKGKPVSDRMLTPVIFRQGKVVAIGAYQYKKLQRTGSLGRQKQERATIRAAS
jgi:hypothetical protein